SHITIFTLLPYTTLFRSIILFNYDYDEYLSSRGMYENINDYPFYITDNINELVDYINKEDPVEYSNFTDKFCPKDSINGSQEIRSEEHTSELQSRFDIVC